MGKTAVLVVHGVGETTPGATVDALLPSLTVADPTFQQDGDQKVLWLPDLPPPGKHWTNPNTADAENDTPVQPNDPHFYKVFPVHVRAATRTAAGGKKTAYEFSEVYWADLSQVRDSWLHLLLGIFYVVFDLPHLARAAAAQDGRIAAKIVQHVISVVSWLLLKITAPMTAFLGLTLATCAITMQAGVSFQEYEPILLPAPDGNKEIPENPEERKKKIYVDDLNDEELRFRIFDNDGKPVVDIDERTLTEQAPQIEGFRTQFNHLWVLQKKRSTHKLTEDEKNQIVTSVTAIISPCLTRSRLERNGEWAMFGLGLFTLIFGSFWAIAVRSRSQPWLGFWSSFAFVGLSMLALVWVVWMKGTGREWAEWASPALLVTVLAYSYWRRLFANVDGRVAFGVGAVILVGIAIVFGFLAYRFRDGQLQKVIDQVQQLYFGTPTPNPEGVLTDPASQHQSSDQAGAMCRSDNPLTGPAWYVAVILLVINLVFLMQTLWMFLGLLVWIWVRVRPAICRRDDPIGVALGAGYVAAIVQLTLWKLMASVLFALALQSDWAKPLKFYSDRLYNPDSFVYFLALGFFVGFSGWLTWVLREWQASGLPPSVNRYKNKRVIRLVMGLWIEYNLIFAWIVVSGLVAYMTTTSVVFPIMVMVDPQWKLPAWLEWINWLLGWVDDRSDPIVAGVITVLVLTTGFMARPLAAGLHIVMDVINHFNKQDPQALLPNLHWQEVAKAFQDRKCLQMMGAFCKWLFWPVEKDTSPPAAGPGAAVLEPDHKGHLRRRRIAWRLRAVLYRVLTDTSVTRLVVVAHSQGTIITVDVLNDHIMTGKLKQRGGLKVVLLTMGSPFTYLYQRYFPSQYPSVVQNPGHWTNLLTNVTSWTNIFRIDDFVGTHIEHFEQPAGTPFVQENPVDAGGHTNYWSQRDVTEIINQVI
jgi:hypothetical protein